MLSQQALPHGHQTHYVAAHSGLVAPDQAPGIGQRGFDVHRAMAAQTGKAGVHFSADTACSGASGTVLRPQVLVGKLLRQVFPNRQGVPDRELVIQQHRHLAGGCQLADRLLEGRRGIERVKAQHHFFKRNLRLLEQHPGAHRPGGVVFVADNQFEHGVLLISWGQSWFMVHSRQIEIHFSAFRIFRPHHAEPAFQ